MSEKKSVFQVLSSINVSDDVKKKNNFNYLSWASAVETLLKHYPEATWEHRTWDDLPYLQTGAGCFVEVSVTINGITRKQIHPVFDFRNKSVMKPDSMQINNSLQRALAKAIALHGLGLNVFIGEDLPLSEREAMDSAKDELKQLLIKAGKFTKEGAVALNNMGYDQLVSKINEYKNKGE